MKTKQALLLLFASLSALTATAQDFKCEDNFKILEDKVIAKSYDDAVVLLPALRKSCPKFSDKLYVYGETILKYKAEAARKPEDQKLFNQSLADLYAEQEKNFPNTGGNVKKAVLLHEQKLATDDEVYKLLDASFAANPQGFTDYNAIELYFNLYVKKYEAGDKGITQDEFIQKYSNIAGQVAFSKNYIAQKSDELLKKQKTETLEPAESLFIKEAATTQKSLEAVGENISNKAAKYFNCDKLDAFYSGSYEKNKNNIAWLQAMVRHCTITNAKNQKRYIPVPWRFIKTKQRTVQRICWAIYRCVKMIGKARLCILTRLPICSRTMLKKPKPIVLLLQFTEILIRPKLKSMRLRRLS